MNLTPPEEKSLLGAMLRIGMIGRGQIAQAHAASIPSSGLCRDVQSNSRNATAQFEVVTIGADDSIEAALQTMKQHAVRRLPVIDGDQLVGMVSQGDIAKNIPEQKTGDLVEAISAAP
jgi:CBS-domain-containing membrane protein